MGLLNVGGDIHRVTKKYITDHTSHRYQKDGKRTPLKGKAMQILLGLHAIYSSPVKHIIYPLSGSDERVILAFAEFAGKHYVKGTENGTPVYTNRGFEAAKSQTKISANSPGELLYAIAKTYAEADEAAINWNKAAKLVEQLIPHTISAGDGMLYAEHFHDDASIEGIRKQIWQLLEGLRTHYKQLDHRMLGVAKQVVKKTRIAKYVSRGVYAMLKCQSNESLPPIENSMGGFIELAAIAEVAGRYYNENGKKMAFPTTDETISQQEPHAMFTHILNAYKKSANADFKTIIAEKNMNEFIECLPEKVEEKGTTDQTVAAALLLLLFNEIPKQENRREIGIQLSLGI